MSDLTIKDKRTRITVKIPANGIFLDGILTIPSQAKGILLFAHGSGSSRHSPRNNFVATVLNDARFGTLLMDLLTSQEDASYDTRFDIELLTRRLEQASKWVKEQPGCAALPVGFFGASTGAAAALNAAATLGSAAGAVVSRGGRPDLATEALPRVQAPTLLIVGSLDDVVIELNRQAYRLLKSEKQLAIVKGATHLFEEPGTLEEVARLATAWFTKHLGH